MIIIVIVVAPAEDCEKGKWNDCFHKDGSDLTDGHQIGATGKGLGERGLVLVGGVFLFSAAVEDFEALDGFEVVKQGLDTLKSENKFADPVPLQPCPDLSSLPPRGHSYGHMKKDSGMSGPQVSETAHKSCRRSTGPQPRQTTYFQNQQFYVQRKT